MINTYTYDISLTSADKRFIEWYCEEFARDENELTDDLVNHAISDFKYFSGYLGEDEEDGEDD